MKKNTDEFKNKSLLLEKITQTIGIGVAIISREYKTIWANEVIKDLFGKTIEGKLCYSTYNQREEVCPNCGVKEVFETGALNVVHEQKGRDADGNLIWSQIIASPIFDKDGNVESAVEVVVPITERKIAEEELKKINEKFRHSRDLMHYVISHAQSAIAVHDRDLNYIYVSDRYLKEYGVKEENVIGKHHYEVFPDLPQKWRDVHQRCLKGEILSAEEDPYFREDGSVEWTRWECRPWYESDGSVGGFIVYTEVITERKRQEEERLKMQAQLQQAAKMQAVGTLAGGIAHDLNNILSIILGNADLALLNISKGNPVINNIERIIGASDRAKNMVNQILAFSRRQESDMKSHCLQHHINEILTLLRPTIPSSVSIQQHIDSDCRLVVADPTQIHQLLMNLCNNAVQAMAEKGELIISLAEVELKEHELDSHFNIESGVCIRLTVSDTGIGMSKQTIEHIFDPFYTTKGLGKGTGMGLSVVYGIVENHKGGIKVESEPGKGSSFHIYFPITRDEDKKTPNKSETLLPGDERILFIDDEDQLAEVWAQVLKQLGYQVSVKTNSNDALELFKSNPNDFDLLITDQTMPQMSGTELAIEILKIRPDMPIILCTGYSSIVSAEKAKQIGIRKFCMKPLNKLQLATAVRNVLDNKPD